MIMADELKNCKFPFVLFALAAIFSCLVFAVISTPPAALDAPKLVIHLVFVPE